MFRMLSEFLANSRPAAELLSSSSTMLDTTDCSSFTVSGVRFSRGLRPTPSTFLYMKGCDSPSPPRLDSVFLSLLDSISIYLRLVFPWVLSLLLVVVVADSERHL